MKKDFFDKEVLRDLDLNNIVHTPRKPKQEGEKNRRAKAKEFTKLDKRLEKNMGTSRDEITKAGKPRKEYFN